MLGGGVDTHEEQVYIKNIKKTGKNTLSRGGVVSQLGVFTSLGEGGVTISLVISERGLSHAV